MDIKELSKKMSMRLLIGILAFLVCSPVYATEINLGHIMRIESSGNTMAHNKRSGARGLYQITPVCLKDFNRAHGTHYKPVDMHDPQKGSRVAYWYLNERIPALLGHYGIKDTLEHRLFAYNAGIGTLLAGRTPKETLNYINAYKRLERA